MGRRPKAVLDFTSVLYLDWRHRPQSLRPWARLTAGVPAVLAEPAAAREVAGCLARLQGTEAAVTAPSTLHLFWDLLALLATHRSVIYLDAGTYPIARWGVARAEALGTPVRSFPHRDAAALVQLIKREPGQRRPIIVSDGVCGGCGCAAPIAAYQKLARRRGGLLVLDDTQALGLLGHSPTRERPYGRGGGGSLRNQQAFGPEVLLVSSLAKAFGAPLAVLSGSEVQVRRFRRRSKTRVHCSPPSLAALHAAARALDLNPQEGEQRRARLARNVQHFQRRLAANGLKSDGGLFPVQTLRLPTYLDTARLHQALLGEGIQTILRRGCDGRRVLSLVLTARHRRPAIDRAVETISELVYGDHHR